MQARRRFGLAMAVLAASLASAGCAGVGIGVAGASGQGFGVGLSLSPDALFRRPSATGPVAPPPRIEDAGAAPVPAIVETFESKPATVAR